MGPSSGGASKYLPLPFWGGGQSAGRISAVKHRQKGPESDSGVAGRSKVELEDHHLTNTRRSLVNVGGIPQTATTSLSIVVVIVVVVVVV